MTGPTAVRNVLDRSLLPARSSLVRLSLQGRTDPETKAASQRFSGQAAEREPSADEILGRYVDFIA